MNNFNCIDDSSYDIITETNTGGYIHMNNKDLYLLLDKDTKEIFEDYIKKDKNCIELLLRICKHKSYGVGLYAFSIDNKDYMKEEVRNNKKFILKVNIHYRRLVNLSNPKRDEIDKLLKYEKEMKLQNLSCVKEYDFIESLLKIVNIKPDLFKVNYLEKAGLECRTITKFFGSLYFIRKNDIERLLDNCEVIAIN